MRAKRQLQDESEGKSIDVNICSVIKIIRKTNCIIIKFYNFICILVDVSITSMYHISHTSQKRPIIFYVCTISKYI